MEKAVIVSWVIISVLFSITDGRSQSNDIIRSGLFKSELTFSPSYNFASKSTSYYLHGVFEGYLNKQVSAAGEGYYEISNSINSPFSYNHSLFYGLSYHITQGNNDLFLGIQPGFSVTRLKNPEETSATGINPLISTVAGYNFYVSKIFHFFLGARFMTGMHQYDQPVNLTEFRMSAGLGFNLNTIKMNRN